MSRSMIQRGVAAVAFVTVLTLAGAQPAAAAKTPRADGRMVTLWSMLLGAGQQAVAGVWQSVKSVVESGTLQPENKRGWGIDPNGHDLTIGDDDPYATTDGGN